MRDPVRRTCVVLDSCCGAFVGATDSYSSPCAASSVFVSIYSYFDGVKTTFSSLTVTYFAGGA